MNERPRALQFPSTTQIANIVVQALRAHGGELSIQDLHAAVAASDQVTEEQVNAVRSRGGSELQYRTRWALVWLKQRNAVSRAGSMRWRLASGPGNADPLGTS